MPEQPAPRAPMPPSVEALNDSDLMRQDGAAREFIVSANRVARLFLDRVTAFTAACEDIEPAEYHELAIDSFRLTTWVEREDSKFGYALVTAPPYASKTEITSAWFFHINRDEDDAERVNIEEPRYIVIKKLSERDFERQAEELAERFDKSELEILSASTVKLANTLSGMPNDTDDVVYKKVWDQFPRTLAQLYPGIPSTQDAHSQDPVYDSLRIAQASRRALRNFHRQYKRHSKLHLQHQTDSGSLYTLELTARRGEMEHLRVVRHMGQEILKGVFRFGKDAGTDQAFTSLENDVEGLSAAFEQGSKVEADYFSFVFEHPDEYVVPETAEHQLLPPTL